MVACKKLSVFTDRKKKLNCCFVSFDFLSVHFVGLTLQETETLREALSDRERNHIYYCSSVKLIKSN